MISLSSVYHRFGTNPERIEYMTELRTRYDPRGCECQIHGNEHQAKKLGTANVTR